MFEKKRIKILIPLLAVFLLLFASAGCSTQNNSISQARALSGENAPAATDGELRVHFIDVGQGDSALITCDGHAMLIDAGQNDMGTTVQMYLQKQNISELDYAVGTHPDADHIGGLDVILYKFPVQLVLMPDEGKDTRTYDDVVQIIKRNNIKRTEPEVGAVYTLGSASFQIVSCNKNYPDANNHSIGIRLTYGDTHFLFCGDAEREAEYDMLESGCDLTADVYKVSHHGSNTASTEAFLNAVEPEYAVISCGEGNDYGHPHKEVMERLENHGVEIFRTDEQGTVIAITDGSSITWQTQKEETDANTVSQDGKDVPEPENTYILNTRGKKFHRPDCASVQDISSDNKEQTVKTRDELIDEGYSPCKRCHP